MGYLSTYQLMEKYQTSFFQHCIISQNITYTKRNENKLMDSYMILIHSFEAFRKDQHFYMTNLYGLKEKKYFLLNIAIFKRYSNEQEVNLKY